MQTLKLAVVGAGHLGRIHARLVAELPGAKLVAIVDPVAAACRELADQTGAEAMADYRDLVGKVDAAIVATPTDTHGIIGILLLSKGVHCLVEKPLAANLVEADALCRAARKGGAVLQVGHVERFNPALAPVLPHLSDPKYIDAVRSGGFSGRSTDIGVVLDLMIHDLDLVLSLVDSPVRQVQALGVSILGQHEDMAQARVTFESGCVANFTASRVGYTGERRMQIFTPGTMAAIDFAHGTSTIVRPSAAVLRRELNFEMLSPEQKIALKENFYGRLLSRETIEPTAGNAIADEQRDFVQSIAAGRTPRVPGEQGRAALALARQILDQIDAHRWDGCSTGRVGPFALPNESIIPGPHFQLSGVPRETAPRREAG